MQALASALTGTLAVCMKASQTGIMLEKGFLTWEQGRATTCLGSAPGINLEMVVSTGALGNHWISSPLYLLAPVTSVLCLAGLGLMGVQMT